MEAHRPIWVSTLHDLITAPLTAVIEADFIAAREFARYISEYGFEPPRKKDSTKDSELPKREEPGHKDGQAVSRESQGGGGRRPGAGQTTTGTPGGRETRRGETPPAEGEASGESSRESDSGKPPAGKPPRKDGPAGGARRPPDEDQLPEGFIGNLRMVSFRVDQPDPDGRLRSRVVRIPALSLVPLPLLQVKEADFSFAVRILEAHVEDEKPGPVHLFPRPENEEPDDYQRLKWRAILVPAGGGERDDPSLRDVIDANMKVRLSVRQSDIPAGITRLLALMNESAHIVAGSIHLSRRRIELSREQPETLKITVINFKGEPAHCGVKAYFPVDSKISLEGDGQPWQSGGTVETKEDGTISLRLTLNPESLLQEGEQVIVRFLATADGVDISESLYVVVQ